MNPIYEVLEGLMRRYKKRVPDVSKVTQALIDQNVIEKEEDISNDHIAFRTMGLPNLGIQSFEKIFVHYGYKVEDDFNFEAKKLNARWYSPPEASLPRIFISELRVNELTVGIQQIIGKYTKDIITDPVDELNLDNARAVDQFLHSPLWSAPTWEDFKILQKESEYAAWVIYNRYYLNHYTISVHDLKEGYNTLEKFIFFLKSIGVILNDSGGIVKKSADGFLIQSSTVSQLCNAKFANGEYHEIAGSYVEFCERKVLKKFEGLPIKEIKREHRREGFEVGNADKIFESTNLDQIKKRA